MNSKSTLEQELRLEGADQTEARQLAELAGRMPKLRQFPGMPPALAVEHRQIRRRFVWRRLFSFAGLSTAGIIVAVIAGGVIAAAQSALPGEPLYSVKRGTEAVALSFQPHLHDQIMMNRAGEVSALVAAHRDPSLIQATLASYDQAVKQSPGSYAAREYCASMLRDAAGQANPSTRAQIMQSLSRLHLDST